MDFDPQNNLGNIALFLEEIRNNQPTKREQFAMFAMQGILANGKCSQFTDTIDLIAEASIRLADALIEALNNSPQS